ncbi:chlorohydrolase [Streptococcus pneumoniae]|nr:chlorohydrolase [Streptococcus pneumoniae]
MKIKEQTRRLAAVAQAVFEVIDKTDEVSSKHGFEVADRTDEASNYIRQGDVDAVLYGKATMTWFEEIFEEEADVV